MMPRLKHIVLVLAATGIALGAQSQILFGWGGSREYFRLKGKVKTVNQARWDGDNNFMERNMLTFSRTGRTLEQTVLFGESDNDIAESRMYDYNGDGVLAGYYRLLRGGEKHTAIDAFTHWLSFYDKGNHLLRTTAFERTTVRDRYDNTIWTRTHEELFTPRNGVNDTVYTFDKKTGRTVKRTYTIVTEERTQQGSTSYSYNSRGDTLAIVYHDPTGQFPKKTGYAYTYAKTEAEKAAEAAADTNAGKPRAVSPVLQKRLEQERKKGAKEPPRIETKTVTTTYGDESTAVREERYDDSSHLVMKRITTTDSHSKKTVREWHYNEKRQLTEEEETRYIGEEVVFNVKSRYSYDKNGDPISCTKSGRSISRPAIWRCFYSDYDDEKNWSRCRYVFPANEVHTEMVSPTGNIIEKVSYEGETTETITRMIKYY